MGLYENARCVSAISTCVLDTGACVQECAFMNAGGTAVDYLMISPWKDTSTQLEFAEITLYQGSACKTTKGLPLNFPFDVCVPTPTGQYFKATGGAAGSRRLRSAEDSTEGRQLQASTRAATYAVTRIGTYVGDDSAGGYIGSASYIAQTGIIATNKNSFLIGNSTHTVCISDLSNGRCGADRTYGPGAYKFSLFGHTRGSNFAASVGDKSFVVFRTKLDSSKMPANSAVYINGDMSKNFNNIGNEELHT